MAEGKDRYTNVREHDECTPIPCDPCKYENNACDSIGYCVECNEYLCDQCTQFHKKFQITRSHVIVEGEKIVRTKEERAEEALLPMMFCDGHRRNEVAFFCLDHKQAFCGLCKAIKHHSCLQCSKLEDIAKPEDSEKIEGAIETLEIDMDDFRKSNDEKIVELDKVRQSMLTCKQRIANSKATLFTLFEQLEKELDTVELEVEAECQSVKEDVTVHADIITHLSDMLEQLKQVTNSDNNKVSFMALLKATKLSHECKIIRSTLVSKERRPLFTIQVQENQEFSKVLANISGLGSIVKRPFSYGPSEPQSDQVSGIVKKETVDTNHDNLKLANEISSDTGSIVKEVLPWATGTSQRVDDNPQKVGEGHEDEGHTCSYTTKGKVQMTSSGDIPSDISTKKSVATSSGNTEVVERAKKSNFSDLKTEYVTKRSIKSKTDFKVCDITGLTVLQNGCIVLCDHSNRKVKLLSPDFSVIRVCPTGGKPWDVAERNHTEVVITLTTDRVLQFLSISNDNFKLGRKINTKMPNWGIDIFDDHLYITQHNNPGNGRVEIRKMDGHIVRQLVFKDWFASDFLGVPSYITVHNDSKNIRMYVTDGQEKTIVCLNPEDNIRHVRNLGLNWPKGLLTDGKGNCLVCIRFGNKLKLVNYSSFEVSPTNGSVGKNVAWGGKCDVWANGCINPQAISMRWHDQTLFVGTGNSDELLVAKLK